MVDRFENYLLFVGRNPEHILTQREWNNYLVGKPVKIINGLKPLNILARQADRKRRQQLSLSK